MSFSGWKDGALGEIINFRRGHDLTKNKMVDGFIPVVGSNGVIGFHNEFTTKSPCLTIGRSGNIGTPHYLDRDCWAHNTTLYIDDFKGNTPKYLFYLLRTLNLSNYGGGSAVPTLNRNHIHPLNVRYTTNLEEQKAIAHTLSTLDDKIEVNNQINKTLKNMAQAIFKQWFVDFEFPNEDGEPYKSSGGEMVESEFGMIPKGWEVRTAYELFNSISVKHGFPKERIIFLNTSDVFNGEVLLHGETLVNALPGQAKKSIQKHDILYSEIRPQNRRFAYIDFESDNYVASTKLMVLRSTIIDPAIAFFLLTNEDTISKLQVMAESRSGTFPQITFDSMKYIKIILPCDLSFLNNLSNALAVILKMILDKKTENRKLKELRDSLLPKLMSGEIRVPFESGGEIS